MDSFDNSLSLLEAADRSDGWLAACEERHVYLALNREFVAALAGALGAEAEVLELGAADGQLALALQSDGVRVIATSSLTGRAPTTNTATANGFGNQLDPAVYRSPRPATH